MKFHGRRHRHGGGELNRGYKYGHKVAPRASIVFGREMFDALMAEACARHVPLATVVREKIATAIKNEATKREAA